jgi:hypothetical protein
LATAQPRHHPAAFTVHLRIVVEALDAIINLLLGWFVLAFIDGTGPVVVSGPAQQPAYRFSNHHRFFPRILLFLNPSVA